MITPISAISFTSRKKEIRKADDISRKTSSVFPVISSTRFSAFGNEDKWTLRQKRSVENLKENIFEQRDKINDRIIVKKFTGCNKAEIVVMPVLQTIQETKKGNCFEISSAALGILYSKGYLNSRRANLYNEISYYTEDGKLIKAYDEPIDHSVVITSMKKDDDFDEKECNIVIDPWANITDYKQNACLKYKTIFRDEIKKLEKKRLNSLKRQYDFDNYMGKKHENFIPDNCKVRSRLYFKVQDDDCTHEDVKNLADSIVSEFEEI